MRATDLTEALSDCQSVSMNIIIRLSMGASIAWEET